MADKTFNLLTKLDLNSDDFKKGIEASKANIKNLVAGIEGTTGSVSEMKRAMRELNSISFAGKTKEEVTALNQKIGDLKDAFGDLKSQQQMMGTEMGNMVAKGLQGVAALGEIVVAVASAFGTSKEQAQKYQAVMVTLIGVSQALGTIEDVLTTRLYQNMAVRIKKIVVTQTESVVTGIATAAQWLYNAALGVTVTIIGGAIIVIAALAYGLYKLVGWINDSNDSEKQEIETLKLANAERLQSKKIMEEVGESASKTLIPQKVHIDNLIRSINSENTSLAEKKKMISELINLDPKYLNGLTLANLNTESGKLIIGNYIAALGKKAESMALESELVKQYSKKYTDNLAYENLVLGIQAQKIMLVNGLKNMTFGYGEAEDLRDKITLNEKLAETAKKRVDGDIKQIDKLSNKMAKLKPANVEFNDGKKDDKKGDTKQLNEYEKVGNKVNELKKELEILIATKGSPKAIEETRDKLKEAIIEANKLKDALDKSLTAGNGSPVIKPLTPLKAQKIEDGSPKSGSEEWTKMYGDKLKVRKTFNKNLKKLENEDAKEQKEIDKAKKESSLYALSETFSIAKGLFAEHTVAYKAMAMIQAGIDTYMAANTALASAPPPYNFVLMGAVITAGLINVAKIAGFTNGGIVPGSNYGGDRTLIRVNPDEMVLNSGQQSTLFSMANGAGNSNNQKELVAKVSGSDLIFVLRNTERKIKNTR